MLTQVTESASENHNSENEDARCIAEQPLNGSKLSGIAFQLVYFGNQQKNHGYTSKNLGLFEKNVFSFVFPL